MDITNKLRFVFYKTLAKCVHFWFNIGVFESLILIFVMKFLVTGGAGFIGSHIVELLLARGHSVRVLDNLSTGKREQIPAEAEFIEADIRNLQAIQPAFEGIEGVFHLAAMPRVQVSIDEPIETHDININGTLNVLLAAKNAKIKRLVYSASAAVYGTSETLPTPEATIPDPLSPYALQKYVGEQYTKLASMFWGFETVSLRYFNAYGPRAASEGAYVNVIAIFNRQSLNKEPLTITGDGKQTRDFIHVSDIADANFEAMTNPKVGHGEVINIGSGQQHSVLEVAELIGGNTLHIPPRVEPRASQADITLARTLLNWEPKTHFPEGMRHTTAWYQANKHLFTGLT